MKFNLHRLFRTPWGPTALLPLAVAIALPAQVVMALEDDRGKIIVEMEGRVSEARWEGDESLPAQTLGQGNPCLLEPSGSDLLAFAPSAGNVGAKFDSIGVEDLGGNGTGCASIDENRGDQESLEIALGADVLDEGLSVKLWILELELKGRRVEFQIDILDGDGQVVETYIVRGGSSAGGGRLPLDYESDEENREQTGEVLIDCFENTDVNPDARDTCVVILSALGQRLVGTALDGSVALESGKSTPLSVDPDWGGSNALPDSTTTSGTSQVYDGEYTQLWLTEAVGELDCGDTTITAFDSATGDFGILRRLENAPELDCTAECLAIPYSLKWADNELQFFADYLVDNEGTPSDQSCAAFAFTVNFEPIELLANGKTATPLVQIERPAGAVATTSDPDGEVFADTVTGQIPLDIIQQFQATDPEYFLDTCEGTPVYATEEPPFLIGDLLELDLDGITLSTIDMSPDGLPDGLPGTQYGCWLNIRLGYGVDEDEELKLEIDGYLRGDYTLRRR